MPIYEYSCPACGQDFEQLSSLGSEGADCPSCGATAVKKPFSRISVVSGQGGSGRNVSCDRSSPCCGAAEPCGDSPCHD